MKKPKFLYHYTSIETFEKIISTQKIKFNRLDKVDDLNEGQSADFGNLGMYIFVSCWSASSRESIPLWTDYSKGMKGVRIKLSSDLFKTYEIDSEPEKAFHVDEGTKTLVPREEIHGPNYLVGLIPDKFLVEVEYTDEFQKIIPRTSYYENEILFGKLGRFKRKEWKYQSEWRFKFQVMPAPPPPKNSYLEYKENFGILTQRAFEKREVAKEYFLLEMKDKAFSQMEVMLGPKCKKEMKSKVQELVKKYNSNVNILESSLKNQIR